MINKIFILRRSIRWAELNGGGFYLDTFWISILQIGTGLFWSIVYILIIKQGFRDKTAGMPMAALSANISWEFIFSFIYPHKGLQVIIDIIWFLLDVIILFQYVKYGRKEFEKTLPAKYFYPILLLTIALSFSIIIATVPEFNDLEGKYAAFAQNLMMSVLFISLLVKRGNTKGQSICIAFFKMIGSFLAAFAFYLYFRSELITILSVGTLIFDLIYIYLLYKQLRKDGNSNIIIFTP
jgi:hypothetical protein